MYYNTIYNKIQKVVIMALTTEDIHAVADQLHADGITPTQTKVREALGGGSFSTIGEALKTWKQELQEHEQLKKSDMPDSLRDGLIVYGAKLWQDAEQIANANLKSDREALAIDKADSQAEVDNAKEAIATLEAEQARTFEALKLSTENAAKATSEAEAAANKITSLNTLITELNHKLDIEQERTASATASLTAANDKLDSTRSQLDNMNNQLTQARESIATYKATNSAQLADIERLQADAIEHKKAHQMTADKLTERTAERDDLAKQISAIQGKLEAVTEQSKQLIAERDSALTDNKALAATNSKLEATNEHLNADKAQLITDLSKVSLECDGLKSAKA